MAGHLASEDYISNIMAIGMKKTPSPFIKNETEGFAILNLRNIKNDLIPGEIVRFNVKKELHSQRGIVGGCGGEIVYSVELHDISMTNFYRDVK